MWQSVLLAFAVGVGWGERTEEPDAGIVAPEADHEVALGVDEQCVPTHRRRREGDVVGEVSLVFVRAGDHLKVVAVEVERVLVGIKVVEDDFDYLLVT